VPEASAHTLNAVSALAPDDVWAVGSVGIEGIGVGTLTEHWNGRRWAIVPSRSPDDLSELNGLVLTSTTDAWAVGYSQVFPLGHREALVEHWNGSRWAVVETPSDGHTRELRAVTAVSAVDSWMVGVGSVRPSGLTEHWDGSAWSVVDDVPTPGYGWLLGVDALSSDDVWAVGNFTTHGTQHAFHEHWDGMAWSIP
jgi:hypothetical protein